MVIASALFYCSKVEVLSHGSHHSSSSIEPPPDNIDSWASNSGPSLATASASASASGLSPSSECFSAAPITTSVDPQAAMATVYMRSSGSPGPSTATTSGSPSVSAAPVTNC